jgi:ribosomal-protein-alanine N-acetyltransferase
MTAVRVLGLNDLDALVALEAHDPALSWSPAAVRAELVHDDAAVLGVFGVLTESLRVQLLGYIAVRRIVDEAWVMNLLAHPHARRRGLGSLLLDAAFAQARHWGMGGLWLEVRESNLGARALYERRGFVVVGRRPGYYPPLRPSAPRETALLMQAQR